MTPACETILNPFIGSECGKVVVRSGNVFTPLTVLTIIPKQHPFVNDCPIPILRETSSADDSNALRLNGSLQR